MRRKNGTKDYPMRFEVNMKYITSAIIVISAIATTGFWIKDYHDTLATKREVNLIFIETSIRDAQDNLFYYDDMELLTPSQQRRYDKIQTNLSKLEEDKDAIIGLKR